MKRKLKTNEGFTLVELLLAVIILALTLTSLIQVFLRCSVLTELARNKTTVMSEIQGKMEEIRNHDFDLITTDYASGGTPGNIFSLSQLNGTGVIYISNFIAGDANLLQVKVVASWENQNGRIIGEDLDLDGVLDISGVSEDVDNDGQLSSIATVMSLISKR